MTHAWSALVKHDVLTSVRVLSRIGILGEKKRHAQSTQDKPNDSGADPRY